MYLRVSRDKLWARVFLVFSRKPSFDLHENLERFFKKHGQAGYPSLIHQDALYVLPDPPGGVSIAIESIVGVELFHSSDETKIAFLCSNDWPIDAFVKVVSGAKISHRQRPANRYRVLSGKL